MREFDSKSDFRIAVISPAPATPGTPPPSGVAAYAIELLEHLPKSACVTVLSQDTSKEWVHHSRIMVLPCWTPGWGAAVKLVESLKKIEVDLIHVQHEFSLYGNPIATMRVVRAIRRYSNKKIPVVTTLHSVVPEDKITATFLRKNGLPPFPLLGRFAFRRSVKEIRKLSAKVVVHHEFFRQVLVDDHRFSPESIRIIPIGSRPNLNRKPAIYGGSINILVFGFLTSYKSPELVVSVAREMKLRDTTFRFSIAENPRARSKSYRDRYSELEKSVRELGTLASWQGFVPDEEVSSVFEMSDILVLPYTECISVSAVAELARQHGLIVCHSAPLNQLLGDSKYAFELTSESLTKALNNAINSRRQRWTQTSSVASWTQSAQLTFQLWQETLGCE